MDISGSAIGDQPDSLSVLASIPQRLLEHPRGRTQPTAPPGEPSSRVCFSHGPHLGEARSPSWRPKTLSGLRPRSNPQPSPAPPSASPASYAKCTPPSPTQTLLFPRSPTARYETKDPCSEGRRAGARRGWRGYLQPMQLKPIYMHILLVKDVAEVDADGN